MRPCGRAHILQGLPAPGRQTSGAGIQKCHRQHRAPDPDERPGGTDHHRFVHSGISSIGKVDDDGNDGAEGGANEEAGVEHVVVLDGKGVDEFNAANTLVLYHL